MYDKHRSYDGAGLKDKFSNSERIGYNMHFLEYIESHQGKRVTILGAGVSNLPLARLLAGAKISVTVRDKKSVEALGETGRELTSLGCEFITGEDYLEGISADIIYRSPGIRPDLPQIEKAVAMGARLTSEMEAFFSVCPCRIIGVTGTEGKTTTSTILSKLLEKGGYRCFLGGNIGTPLLDRTPELRPEDFVVVELSSFQLMTMRMSPDIAVVTNIVPDHLDFHRSMEEYIAAKRNIYAWQKPGGRLVLNRDNPVTYGQYYSERPDALLFSRETDPANGLFLHSGRIYVSENGCARELMPVDEIMLPGLHNVENYMAAAAALRGIVGAEDFRTVARSFGGVAHRIEFIRELDGVRYYNDSVSTTPSSTIAGIRAFKRKVVLIAGGSDKNLPFDPLAKALEAHVKALVLIGATKGKIRAAAEAEGVTTPIFEAETLEQAVALAKDAADEAGDVVFFSPACASFDMFSNFADRGDKFRDIVIKL